MDRRFIVRTSRRIDVASSSDQDPEATLDQAEAVELTEEQLQLLCSPTMLINVSLFSMLSSPLFRSDGPSS